MHSSMYTDRCPSILARAREVDMCSVPVGPIAEFNVSREL